LVTSVFWPCLAGPLLAFMFIPCWLFFPCYAPSVDDELTTDVLSGCCILTEGQRMMLGHRRCTTCTAIETTHKNWSHLVCSSKYDLFSFCYPWPL
jgi:hypothetical protein